MSSEDGGGGGGSASWVLRISEELRGREVAGAGITAFVLLITDPVAFVRWLWDDYLLGFLQSELVEWILSGWSWFLNTAVGGAYDVVELLLVDGIAIPLSTAAQQIGGGLLQAFQSIQAFSESELMALGVGAPFALVISWLVTAIIVAGISQLIWGFIETYLPIESLSGAWGAIKNGLTGGDDE